MSARRWSCCPRARRCSARRPAKPGAESFESAPHPVGIDKPFAVGRYAVTFAQWDACFAESGCGRRRLGDLDFGRANRPAIFATWTEAQLYVDWLKRKTGQPYRLLSEAEWEYAARGCRSLKCVYAPFWFGAIKPELAAYDTRRSYEGSPKAAALLKTAPVDNGPANPFGLVQHAWQCAAVDPGLLESGPRAHAIERRAGSHGRLYGAGDARRLLGG